MLVRNNIEEGRALLKSNERFEIFLNKDRPLNMSIDYLFNL